MRNDEKPKVSKTNFAEGLYYWLSEFVTEEKTKEIAEKLSFEIRSNEDFSKVYEELLALNMWLILYSCAGKFEDREKLVKVLNIFHHLVYKEKAKGTTEEDFNKWMKSMDTKYNEYETAIESNMGTYRQPTWLMVVAKQFSRNLFREIKEDLEFKMGIVDHIGHIKLFVEKLEEMLEEIMEKCDIE
jgi:hypothetical protein